MKMLLRASALALGLSTTLASQQFTDLPFRGLFPELAPNTSFVVPRLFDSDGDGDLDLFVDGRVFENATDGLRLFREVLPPPAIGGDVRGVVDGDLDADGDVDLVCVLEDGTVRLLRNAGSGTFTSEVVVAAADAVLDVELGDVDGDGDLDMIVARGLLPLFGPLTPPACRLLINDGAGGFVDESTSRWPASNESTGDLAVFDADGDGDLDVVRSFEHNTPTPAEFWENDGTGVFVSRSGRLPTFPLFAVTAGDIDGDGDTDLVATRDGVPFEAVLVNDGTGTFVDGTLGRLRPLTPDELFLAAIVSPSFEHRLVDLDGDGVLDLAGSVVVTNKVRLGNGVGGFLAERPEHPATERSAIGDVDGDGVLDVFDREGLCLGRPGGGFVNESPTDSLPIDIPGLGAPADSVTFRRTEIDVSPALASLLGVAAADVDGDGDQDLLVPLQQRDASSFPVLLQYRLVVRADDGSPEGTVVGDVLSTPEPLDTIAPPVNVRAVPFDADGDGDVDVFMAVDSTVFGAGNQPRLFLGDGAGGFVEAPAGTLPVGPHNVLWAVALDLASDGDVDILFGTPSGPVEFVNDGVSAFTIASVPPLTGEFAFSAAVADFDQDGDEDVAITRLVGGPFGQMPPVTRLMRNDAGVGLVDAGVLGGPGSIPGSVLSAADVDDDGDVDVLVGPIGGGSPELYRNDGTGGFVLAAETFPQQLPVALDDVDRDGDLDLVGRDGRIHVNRRRQSEFVDLLRVGRSSRLRIVGWSADPSVTSFAALPILGFAPARLGTELGEFGIAPATAVELMPRVFAGPQGSVEIVLTTPSDPTLVGLEVWFQTLLVESGATVQGRLTNAVRARVFGG